MLKEGNSDHQKKQHLQVNQLKEIEICVVDLQPEEKINITQGQFFSQVIGKHCCIPGGVALPQDGLSDNGLHPSHYL